MPIKNRKVICRLCDETLNIKSINTHYFGTGKLQGKHPNHSSKPLFKEYISPNQLNINKFFKYK